MEDPAGNASLVERLLQGGLYLMLAGLAVVLAVVGAALVPKGVVLQEAVPPPAAPIPAGPVAQAALLGGRRLVLSYGVLLALLGNWLLCAQGSRAARSVAGGALPALAWLLTAMYIGAGRPEGDVVLTNGFNGVAFLLTGTIAAATGVAIGMRRGRPEPRPAP